MFLRIIKRQIAAHLEHRTVLHQPAIILLSECSLLSQGGWNVIPEGKTTSVQLPTVFITRAFRPLVTWDDPTTAIKSSTIFSCGASANTSTITIGLHTENNNGGRGVNWWVIGF